MNLHAAIDSYASLKRSLGAVFRSDARILRSFGTLVGDIPVSAIDPEVCRTFCRGTGPPTRWWERKHYALRAFFTFLVSRGHLRVPPLPDTRPKVQRCFEPYVYSRDELQRLLDATTILHNPRTPLVHLTFRLLLLTLYAAGLRPGEGLRLRCCDVDLSERILAIWDTKFFKSRLVPIGTDLVTALDAYRTARQRLPMPAGSHSAWFASPTGKPISRGQLERVFVRLRVHARIERPPGARWQPRLHDLRHAFAVHRLIAWYREGADVQACLPLLATYLGHVNLCGTQTYLSMTPELLAEASKRFECYAGVGQQQGENYG
jgi:site-specific recombinase XerD